MGRLGGNWGIGGRGGQAEGRLVTDCGGVMHRNTPQVCKAG